MLFDWVAQNLNESNHNDQPDKGKCYEHLMLKPTKDMQTASNAKKYGWPMTKSLLVLVLHLSVWVIEVSGASFLDQSRGEVKQNQSNPGLLSTLNWNLLNRLRDNQVLDSLSYIYSRTLQAPLVPWPPAHNIDLSSIGTIAPLRLLQSLWLPTGTVACWRMSARGPNGMVCPQPKRFI